jgi:two-component system response regulator VicR
MKTILLVDDEYGLLETLTEVLREFGYRVVSASNGRDGFLRAEKEKPDLIITDFMMPIADGMELLRDIRASPPLRSLPVLMISATRRDVALSRQHKGGTLKPDAFLGKPFELDPFLKVIVRLIGKGETVKR